MRLAERDGLHGVDEGLDARAAQPVRGAKVCQNGMRQASCTQDAPVDGQCRCGHTASREMADVARKVGCGDVRGGDVAGVRSRLGTKKRRADEARGCGEVSAGREMHIEAAVKASLR